MADIRAYDTYIIPSIYASAIVNDDYSGLSEEEEVMLDAFFDTLPEDCYWTWDLSEENYFSWTNDVTDLGGDVMDATLYIDVTNWDQENIAELFG